MCVISYTSNTHLTFPQKHFGVLVILFTSYLFAYYSFTDQFKMFVDKLKINLSSRTSYIPRAGYSKLPSSPEPPKINSFNLSKKCGISIPFDPTINFESYLMSIGDLVGDDKLVFAGKNNDLIKIYLVSEFEVNKLLEYHPQVVIDGKVFLLKKLSEHGHRIFLCNTEPEMPDSLLISELVKFTKVVSPMKYMNLGCRNKRFAHLMSFRRTVMVEDVEKLPSYFNLFFDNVICKIFIIIDKVRCFRCQGEGHLSKSCPQGQKEPSNLEQDIQMSDPVVLNSDNPPASALSLPGQHRTVSCDFVPAFASRTETTLPTADNSAAYPSLPSSSAQSAEVASLPDVGNTSCLDSSSKKILIARSDSIESFSSLNPSSQHTDIINEKKRTRDTVSPSGSDSDTDKKKRLVVSNSNTDEDLSHLHPFFKDYDEGVDPVEFTNLISDLRNAQNKIEIIENNYSYDPRVVITVLNKLSTEVFDKKCKSRLKNLANGISKKLEKVNQNPNTQ